MVSQICISAIAARIRGRAVPAISIRIGGRAARISIRTGPHTSMPIISIAYFDISVLVSHSCIGAESGTRMSISIGIYTGSPRGIFTGRQIGSSIGNGTSIGISTGGSIGSSSKSSSGRPVDCVGFDSSREHKRF